MRFFDEFDKSKRVATAAVKGLLQNADRLEEFTPKGYTIKIGEIREGGGSRSDNQICVSFHFDVYIEAPNQTILKQAIEEAEDIVRAYSARVKELKEKL